MTVRTRVDNSGRSRTRGESYVERAIPKPKRSMREIPNPGQATVPDPERRGNKLKVPQQRAPKPRKEFGA